MLKDINLDIRFQFTDSFLVSLFEALNLPELLNHEKREKIEIIKTQLILELTQYDFYIQNNGIDDDTSKMNLIFATDSLNENNCKILEILESALGKKVTLLIGGINKRHDCFLCMYVKVLPFIVGKESNKSFGATINVTYQNYYSATGFTLEIEDVIKKLPIVSKQMSLARNGVEKWAAYVDLLEAHAKEKTIELLFNKNKILYSDAKVSFTSKYEIGEAEIKKLSRLRGANVRIHEVDDDGIQLEEYFDIGTLESFKVESREIYVALNVEYQELAIKNELVLFKNGNLIISDMGDLAQTSRLRNGFELLKKGKAKNEFLEDILFNSSNLYYRSESISEIKLKSHELLRADLNKEQLESVEGILNSKDLYLVQGPPGTGKTTVISEVCYQNAIRGKKTLIASQSNLAVDNALSRLIHRPEIRALRAGNSRSLEKNSSRFIENNVINTWLNDTASYCKIKQEERKLLCQKCRYIIKNKDEVNKILKKYYSLSTNLENLLSEKREFEKSYDMLIDLVDNWDQIDEALLIDIKSYYNGENQKKYIWFRDKVKDYFIKKHQEIESINNIEIFKVKKSMLQDIKDKLIKALGKKYDTTLISKIEVSIKDIDSILLKCKAGLINAPKTIFIYLGLYRKWVNTSFNNINSIYSLDEQIDVESARLDDKLQEIKSELVAINSELYENFYNDFIVNLSNIIEEKKGEINELSRKVENQYDLLLDQLNKFDKELLIHNYKGVIKKRQINDIDNIIIDNLINKYNILEFEIELADEWIESLSSTDRATLNKLKKIYIENSNVVGITCSLSASKRFTEQFPIFDVVIVDEVSKATPPELLLPLLKGKKIVLIGDHKQLPPLLGQDTLKEFVEAQQLKKEEVSEFEASVFETLFTSLDNRFKKMLRTQYRMHNQIMETINQFYNDENEEGLNCGIKEPDIDKNHNLDNELIKANNHVLWVDMPLHKEFKEEQPRGSTSFYNTKEIDVIINLLTSINAEYESKNIIKEIAVISAYKAQSKMLRQRLKENKILLKNLTIKTDTVDNFQGMESEIVIVSFVSNNENGRIGYFKNPKRVNVALSRSKELLIIVACSELFCDVNKDKSRKIYRNVFNIVQSFGGIRTLKQLNKNL